MARQIVQRLSQTNPKTSCLNPLFWSLRHSQKGHFSLTGRDVWYGRYDHEKVEISVSKSITTMQLPA